MLALIVTLNLQGQQRDSLATDTLKKKEVVIEDQWSSHPGGNKKYKETKRKHQNSTKVRVLNKNVVKVVENGRETRVSALGDRCNVEALQDTTKIRIGRRRIDIIDGWHGTRVRVDRVDPWDDDYSSERERGFRGHWAGFEMGVNAFSNEDYSAYPGQNDFMELDLLKSTAVNLNFLQYDISLQKDRNTIGLVTGMGLEWNNYRFDKKITLTEAETGEIIPEALNPDWSIKKSKLTSLYLTVPLLLEFQIPVGYKSRRVNFSAGIVGGLRIASHTKIKYKNNGNTHKDKDHDDFNLKALRYAGQVRLGYKSIKLFATYGLTELFEDGKGPELTPYTVGITLVSF